MGTIKLMFTFMVLGLLLANQSFAGGGLTSRAWAAKRLETITNSRCTTTNRLRLPNPKRKIGSSRLITTRNSQESLPGRESLQLNTLRTADPLRKILRRPSNRIGNWPQSTAH